MVETSVPGESSQRRHANSWLYICIPLTEPLPVLFGTLQAKRQHGNKIRYGHACTRGTAAGEYPSHAKQ